MKVHQIVLTVVDMDDMGSEEVCSTLVNTRYPNRCIAPHVRSVKTKEIGEWTDEHPLNQWHEVDGELERLFGAA